MSPQPEDPERVRKWRKALPNYTDEGFGEESSAIVIVESPVFGKLAVKKDMLTKLRKAVDNNISINSIDAKLVKLLECFSEGYFSPEDFWMKAFERDSSVRLTYVRKWLYSNMKKMSLSREKINEALLQKSHKITYLTFFADPQKRFTYCFLTFYTKLINEEYLYRKC